MTAVCFLKDGIDFKFVVEPQEEEAYKSRFGEEYILVLPENNQGLIYSRNWIKDHSLSLGAERHWQIDDNIRAFYRMHYGKRLYCDPSIALRVVEDFSDRYTNVGLSGLNYVMFAPENTVLPPFRLNAHVYSCTLFNNSLPHRFRPPANEDVDMCLQVIADGYCTVQINAFLAEKRATMKVRGGQTDAAYQGDGRLFMARSLERVWPGVVETKRRFNRPQHVVKDAWRKFDTQLILKPDADLTPKDYGLHLAQVAPIRSEFIQRLLDRANKEMAAEEALEEA